MTGTETTGTDRKLKQSGVLKSAETGISAVPAGAEGYVEKEEMADLAEPIKMDGGGYVGDERYPFEEVLKAERSEDRKQDRRTEDAGEQGAVEEETAPDSLSVIEPLLDQRIVRAVREMGFEKLTPIQVQAIPYLLEGEDIIGQAQTGTGKTAAFAIPALQKLDPELRSLQTIILCPTRELAMQAAEEIRNIAKYMHSIKVLPVYGGQEIRKQINGLRGTQIIVGTPGRVMDHMRRHTIKLDHEIGRAHV